MSKKPEHAPLKVRIEKGQLVISIGVSTLAYAVQNGTEGNFDGLKITNDRGFAKDVLAELLAEEEDGTTVVHKMLDQAALNASEQGSQHVKEDPEDIP